MIKELALVPRVFYSVFFMLVGIYTAFSSPRFVMPFVFSFTFIFVFSLVWQYYVLHFAMHRMNNIWRRVTVGLSFGSSFLLGTWGKHMLDKFDFFQDIATVHENFAWQMGVYLVGAGIFVGTACAWRVFYRHRAL